MKKRIFAFIIALIMVAVLIPAASGAVEGDYAGKLVILHTNDVHSRIDENLGYAAVSALKKEYEDAGADVVLLDAGDRKSVV